MKKQKNISFQKIFHIFTFLLLCIALSACQKKEEKGLEIPEEFNYYKVQTCDINDIFSSSVDCMKYLDDSIYIAGSSNGNSMIAAFDQNGTYVKKTELAFPDIDTGNFLFIKDFRLNENNTIDCIYTILGSNSKNPENSTTSYYYISFNPTGKELSKYSLELPTPKNILDYLITDTTIYLLADHVVFLFDKTGNFLEQYQINKDTALKFVPDSKGTPLIACVPIAENICFKKINDTTKKIETEYTTGLPFSGFFSFNTSIDNTEYDFFTADSTGVYGLYENGKAIQLLSWTDCNIFIDYASFICLNKETFAILYRNRNNGRNYLYILSKQEKKLKTELELVSIGDTQSINDAVKLAVIEWNQQHPDCRIHIYESNESITDLYLDILSGKKVFDIFFTSDHTSLQDLVKNNYFIDYYDLMQQDSKGLQREVFLPNILQLFETKEKHLYSLPVSIDSFSFLAGNKTNLPKTKQWTFQDLNTLIEKQPIGTKIFADTDTFSKFNALYSGFYDHPSKTGLFMRLLYGSFSDIYNITEGLNIEALKKLITFTDQWYPKESDTQQEETIPFLWNCNLRTSFLNNILTTLQDVFGKNGYDFIEYPCEQGNGITIKEGLSFSIAANGANTEAAWDFVQSFCSKDAQTGGTDSFYSSYSSLFVFNFPVRKDAFHEIFEREIQYQPTLKKGVKKLQNFIESSNFSLINQDICNIILEEINTYYSGDKTQEEILNILESRINLYTKEKYF